MVKYLEVINIQFHPIRVKYKFTSIFIFPNVMIDAFFSPFLNFLIIINLSNI